MKKELWKLAIQGIRGRKRSSLLLFLVLLLSFSVAVISLSVTESMKKTNEEYRFDTYGTWYGAITSGKEEDEAFLQESDWLEQYGVTKCYGVISGGGIRSGIGTIDDTFREIGRIRLQDGAFPQSPDEIAVEASVLSGLGYDYELGQEIVLDVGFQTNGDMAYAQKTYKLCGVLKAYTQLWMTPTNATVLLNSAVVTKEAGDELLELAEETIDAYNQAMEEELLNPEEIMPQYYFTVKEGMEDDMVQQVNEYLKETRGVALSVSLNRYAYVEQQEKTFSFVYIALTYVVTLLAVFCIYTIHMQRQVKQIALFRSIGITKKQLRWMSFFETIDICIPAALAGVLLGNIAIRIILRLLVYVGSAEIQVAIPLLQISFLIVFWLLGMFVMRVAALQMAMRQPLIGRMILTQQKIKTVQRWKRAQMAGLMSLFCAAVFFTGIESGTYVHLMKTWKNQASYMIDGHSACAFGMAEDAMTLSKERMGLYRQIPGMDWINGYSREEVKMDFVGKETCDYYQAYQSQPYMSGYNYLYTVPEEKWEDFFEKKVNESDKYAFENGESVFLAFPLDMDGKPVLNRTEEEGGTLQFEKTGIEAGDEITLTFTGMKIEEGQCQEEKDFYSVEVPVGAVLFYERDEVEGVQGILSEPYVVLCSELFLDNIVSGLPDGYIFSDDYQTGEKTGYNYVLGHADMNAGYLSTDYVLAQMCVEDGLKLRNFREAYTASMQKSLQTLLMLLSSGCCIGMILLLMIGNILTLAVRTEQRTYAILQAIGMSKKQEKRIFLKKSFCYSVFAAVIGMGIYGVYYIWTCVQTYQEMQMEYETVSFVKVLTDEIKYRYLETGMIACMFLGCVLVLLLVWGLAKRSLFRGNLLDRLNENG